MSDVWVVGGWLTSAGFPKLHLTFDDVAKHSSVANGLMLPEICVVPMNLMKQRDSSNIATLGSGGLFYR